MALIGQLRNMYGVLTQASEQAGSLLGIADERGLMGVMKKVMGMAPEDMQQTVDEVLGVAALDLFAARDSSAVETVIGFRKYVSDYLDELVLLRDILVKFSSDDPAEKSASLVEMKAITASSGRAQGSPRRERALESETARLHDTLGQIAMLASGGAEGVQRSPQEKKKTGETR